MTITPGDRHVPPGDVCWHPPRLARLKRWLNSSTWCALGFHGSCSGMASSRRPPYQTPCTCRHHFEEALTTLLRLRAR